jgi:addiction module HigA family antidote
MSKNELPPRHPGEILKQDFILPMGLTETALAHALGVHPPRVNELVLKRRGVSADTALRLARYFGGEPINWLLLQAKYDLHMAELAAGKEIEHKVKPRATAPKKNAR